MNRFVIVQVTHIKYADHVYLIQNMLLPVPHKMDIVILFLPVLSLLFHGVLSDVKESKWTVPVYQEHFWCPIHSPCLCNVKLTFDFIHLHQQLHVKEF